MEPPLRAAAPTGPTDGAQSYIYILTGGAGFDAGDCGVLRKKKRGKVKEGRQNTTKGGILRMLHGLAPIISVKYG